MLLWAQGIRPIVPSPGLSAIRSLCLPRCSTCLACILYLHFAAADTALVSQGMPWSSQCACNGRVLVWRIGARNSRRHRDQQVSVLQLQVEEEMDTTWYLCVLLRKGWLLCLTRIGPVTKRTRRAPLASVCLLLVSSITRSQCRNAVVVPDWLNPMSWRASHHMQSALPKIPFGSYKESVSAADSGERTTKTAHQDGRWHPFHSRHRCHRPEHRHGTLGPHR
ncbi:hypothetical protein V8C34DRAFT_211727 [Trichoderma compactum]